MTLWETVLVTEEVVQQIVQLGLQVSPREACGLICPDGSVLELPNRAQGENEFECWGRDIAETLQKWILGQDIPEFTKVDFILWHTHPTGSVGPSVTDLRSRVEGMKCLVVSLPNGEAVQY